MKELLSTGVSVDLTYNEENDALIGLIKGYAVAIKENLQTGSYGCLFWLREGEFTAITTAEEYLTDKQKLDPEYIKKFRVTEQGVAVALNRTNDDFMNISNLKRFIYDFTSSLSLNFYKNCCCECGKTENLAIYSADGVIAQACNECGAKYKFICAFEGGSPSFTPPTKSEPIASAPAATSFGETPTVPAPETTSFTGISAVAEEPKPTEADFGDFVLKEIPAELSPVQEERTAEEAATKEELEEAFSELAFTETKSEPVIPVLTELTAEEKEAEKAAAAELLEEFMYNEQEAVPNEPEEIPYEKEVSDEAMEELMFTEINREPISQPEEESKPIPAVDLSTADEFSQLLAGNSEEKQPEKPRSKLFEEAEREFAQEKARIEAEEKLHNPEDTIDNLLIDENGQIAIKEQEAENDNGASDVTEFRDNTDYGEDFDIEEIESTVEMPTVTTGHPQLEAEETPLEADGSVPLINPNSHREERHVSPVDGPDAVQPLEFAQSAITNETLSSGEEEVQLPPGYADGGNMSREDEPFKTVNTLPNYGSYAYKPVKYNDSSNIIMGIIGILVLGLVGTVVWVLAASVFDVISYWGSLLIVFSVFGGYRLAGGAMDKKGVVISFIMSLVMVSLGAITVSAIEVQQALEEIYGVTVSLSEGFEWLSALLEDEATRKSFVTNLGVSVIITLAADIITAIRLWRNT